MSTIAEPAVGLWTNHGTGQWTLTLSSRNAGILSAALVLFIGTVSVQAWSITRFLLHQYHAGRSAGDGLFQTRQTLLRNSITPTQASWLSLRIVWSWRKVNGTRAAVFRMMLAFVAAVANLVIWLVVGLYISSIWTLAGDQVRINPKACGYIALNTSTTDLARSWTMYWASRLQSASAYEQQCYSSSSNSSVCTRYPSARVPWDMSDTECPYPPTEDLCIHTNSTPMQLDTGFVNSNRDLGMNSEPKDSIDYRRITQCSPMQADYVGVTARNISFYYGQNVGLRSNQTFTYPIAARTLIEGYTLYSRSYDPWLPNSIWQPNTTVFDRVDAQVSIMFLSANKLFYYDRVWDPWFRVGPLDPNEEVPSLPLSNGNTVKLYAPTRDVTIVGCVEQHQICTAAETRNQYCTTPSSLTSTNNQVASLDLNPRQRATATRILFNVIGVDMAFVASSLQGDALLASRTIFQGAQQNSLPSTQWRDEISRWFSIALILLQEGVVQYVTGPSRPEWAAYVSNDASPAEREECATQRIRLTSSQQNFSMTGIVVVLVVGALIIALGLSIDTLAAWLQRHVPKGGQRRAAWVLDGVYQQQRLAFEGLGVRDWEGVGDEIPTSGRGEFPSREGAVQPGYQQVHQRQQGVTYLHNGVMGKVAAR